MDQHIDNLASLQGRRLLQKYWYENLVEGRRWKLGLMFTTLRLCMFGRTLYFADAQQPIMIDHTLGLRLGTRVWMEEISYKHFMGTVQALVYLGAVVLLIFVGLRFANLINERTSLVGIGIEAFMLFMLFVVMFFTPDEEFAEVSREETSGGSEAKEYLALFKEIYNELQDIGTMNAALGRHLTEITNKQEAYLRELSQKLTNAPAAGFGKETADLMHDVKVALGSLSGSIQEMNANLGKIAEKEMEYLVRRELEKMIGRTPEQPRPKG